MLPVDGDDEEVDVVASVSESEHQLGDDVSVSVVGRVIDSTIRKKIFGRFFEYRLFFPIVFFSKLKVGIFRN